MGKQVPSSVGQESCSVQEPTPEGSETLENISALQSEACLCRKFLKLKVRIICTTINKAHEVAKTPIFN